MELVIKPIRSLPCSLEVFTINGKGADQYDFGDIYMTMILKAQSLMRAQICTLTQSLQQRKC